MPEDRNFNLGIDEEEEIEEIEERKSSSREDVQEDMEEEVDKQVKPTNEERSSRRVVEEYEDEEEEKPRKLTFEERAQEYLSKLFNLCIEEGVLDYGTEEAKLIIKSKDDPEQQKKMTMSRDPKEIIDQIPSIALQHGGLVETPKKRREKLFDSLENIADHIEYQQDLVTKLSYVLSQIILETNSKAFKYLFAGISKRQNLRSLLFDIVCESYDYLDQQSRNMKSDSLTEEDDDF